MYSIARLIKELPANYEEECKKQGAVRRWRGVKSPGDLMVLILIHLINGTSLLETSIIAQTAKLGELSDVAFMKRLAQCKDWFVSISQMLIENSMEGYEQPDWLRGKTVVAVDASDVVEKGRTKRTYRLHYALDIFKMASLQCKITTQSVGETLVNFELGQNMLIIADRIYSTINGMNHCLEAGADFVLRMRKNSFTACDAKGETLDLISLFRAVQENGYADFKAFASNKHGAILPVRICAKRKTPEQIKESLKKLKDRERKCGVSKEAKIWAEYIVVVTSLDDSISAEQILDIYRLRWQVEIHFKRLKSILDFGELPKKKPEHSLAWLNGKLMVALLIESVVAKSFSPHEQCRDYNEQEYLA
jgi:hypothetical protein